MKVTKLVSLMMVMAMVITPIVAVSVSAGEAAEEGLEITSLPSRFSDGIGLQFAKEIVYDDGMYDAELSMTSGDTFSYTVSTNITATISISGSASSWLTVSGYKVSGTPTVAGTYDLTITATATTSGQSQTATQTVNIIVFDRLMMRVGDLFSYTVVTNITSTASISGTATSWLTVTDNTISGSPTAAAGTYTLDVTATASTSGVSQTASQSISIQVCERVAVSTSSSTASAAVGSSSGTILKTFASGKEWTGPSGTTISCNVGSSGLFIWDTISESLKLARSVIASDVGTYTVTWTVSYNPSGYEVADTQTHVVTISIYSDLVITAQTLYNTYVGHGSHAITITTNHDGDGSTITKTANIPSSLSAYVSLSNGVITYNFDKYTTASTTTYDTVTFTISASGKLGDVDYTSASQTITIRVYPMLEFVDLPTVSKNVSVISTTDDNLDLIISAEISGAQDIKVYWGDGTFTKIDPTGGYLAGYTARHQYASEGDYNITIVASNDVGDQRAYILYDAYEEGFSAFDGNSPSTGFFDGHGNLWVVALIVGLIAVSVYALGYRQESVILIAFASIALAVLLYITGASI